MRRYPDRPVLGVGAVVFDRDFVLLVERAHPPLQGEWSLPGGAVEVGETLAQAVAREVLEETGLDVRVGPAIEIVDRVHRDADGRVEYHYVVIDYLCAPSDVQLRPGSDAGDARWVAIDDLARYGVSPTAIAVVHKARDLVCSGPFGA